MRPRIGITCTPLVHDDVHYDATNRAYVDAVLAVGGLPLVLPVVEPAHVGDLLDSIDGLVLAGGGDIEPARYGQPQMPEVDGVHPDRDRLELALAKAAIRRDVPLLGVCRGTQVINVALGGTLMQHLPAVSELVHRDAVAFDRAVHDVEVDKGSTLRKIVGGRTIGVNSLHHQAIGELGTGIRATCWSSDGVIEGIELVGRPNVVGVQWHPELLTHLKPHRKLFRWLVRTAAGRVESPPREQVPLTDSVA